MAAPAPTSASTTADSAPTSATPPTTDATTITNAAPPSSSSIAAMPPPKFSLTLILAATPSLGIGRAGGLPWPPHRADMAFFARVTRRVPDVYKRRWARERNGTHTNPPPGSSIPAPEAKPAEGGNGGPQEGTAVPQSPKLRNAVVMGRKTWDSIPERFRPLAGRVNIVLSSRELRVPEGREADVVHARSLEEAVEGLRAAAVPTAAEWKGGSGERRWPPVARVFVIGGARVYEEALWREEADRILLTKMRGEWECDTFFPLDIEGDEGIGKEWERKGAKEMNEWVGEEVPVGVQTEEGKDGEGEGWEFCMFERERDTSNDTLVGQVLNNAASAVGNLAVT